MAETIKIQIVDDTPTRRDNPDLDDFFNAPSSAPKSSGSASGSRANKDLEDFFNGIASSAEKAEPKKPNKTEPAPPTPKAEPNFPDTVDVGGKTYAKDAYEAAQKKLERERQKRAEQDAYDALKTKPPPLPKKIEPNFPSTVNVDGKSIDKKGYEYAQKKMEAEKQAKENERAYDLLNPDKKKAGMLKDPMGQLAKLAPELAVVALAANETAKVLNGMTKNVTAVTDALSTFASNERAGLGQLGDAAAGAIRGPMESIPIIGDVIKAQNDFIDSIIKIPEKLTAAFLKQAEKIAPYSGAVTVANARADVREIMADIKEANGMGDAYASLVDSQSRLDNTVREMLYPIKKFLVEVLAARLEFLADVLEIISKGIEMGNVALMAVPKAIIDLWNEGPSKALDDIRVAAKEIQRIAERQAEKQPDDLYGPFFEGVGAARFSGSFAG